MYVGHPSLLQVFLMSKSISDPALPPPRRSPITNRYSFPWTAAAAPPPAGALPPPAAALPLPGAPPEGADDRARRGHYEPAADAWSSSGGPRAWGNFLLRLH